MVRFRINIRKEESLQAEVMTDTERALQPKRRGSTGCSHTAVLTVVGPLHGLVVFTLVLQVVATNDHSGMGFRCLQICCLGFGFFC